MVIMVEPDKVDLPRGITVGAKDRYLKAMYRYCSKGKEVWVGFYVLKNITPTALKCHFYVFKKYRMLSREIMDAFRKWVLKNIESNSVFYCTVKRSQRDVRHFCNRIGMKFVKNLEDTRRLYRIPFTELCYE